LANKVLIIIIIRSYYATTEKQVFGSDLPVGQSFESRNGITAVENF